MISPPKTLEEARKTKYGRWVALPQGHQYQKGYCAYEIWDRVHSQQCSRKNGYGPEKLYCKQHAKKLKK